MLHLSDRKGGLPALVVALAVAFPLPAADDPLAPVRAQLARLESLRQERPDDGLLTFYLASTRARLGQKGEALLLLRGLFGRRLGLIPARGIGFDEIWADQEFQAIRGRLEAEEPRTPVAPVRFLLRDASLIPEGIAYDAVGRRFYVGSIARRKIVAVDSHGRSRDLSRRQDGLDSVLGIRVDQARRALFAVATNADSRPPQSPLRNAVVRYDLRTGRLTDKWSIPEAVQLNDVAVAADGTLYVTDSGGGSVFRRKGNDSAFRRLGEPGAFRAANGITATPAGVVYVAVGTGLMRVEPATGRAERVLQGGDTVTGGIDGLYWHDGDLVGIQNGPNPGRVVRIGLVDSGSRVAGLTVLQSHHHPAFDIPTTGAIVGDEIFVIANSHVDRLRPDGSIQDRDTVKPAAIVAVPLGR
ncbi:MAG: hypothetical protein DIJKHBIC_02904 [Thermoanaerobaculia bacterium]|nr:hypothetical protein [Thermoanaerobaculia bacterium]